MAQHKIKDPKAIASIVLCTLFLSAVIVLFIVGGILFAQENPKVLNYANTICKVKSSGIKRYTCSTRYTRYTCYGATWGVFHGENYTIPATIEDEKRFRSYSDAIRRGQQYEIDSIHSCWYDTRKPSVAQWNKPSTLAAIILLSFGSLSVLLTGLFLFLSMKFVKQEMLQRAHDGMNPYSGVNVFMKQ